MSGQCAGALSWVEMIEGYWTMGRSTLHDLAGFEVDLQDGSTLFVACDQDTVRDARVAMISACV